jgi:hypothetical protein
MIINKKPQTGKHQNADRKPSQPSNTDNIHLQHVTCALLSLAIHEVVDLLWPCQINFLIRKRGSSVRKRGVGLRGVK